MNFQFRGKREDEQPVGCAGWPHQPMLPIRCRPPAARWAAFLFAQFVFVTDIRVR